MLAADAFRATQIHGDYTDTPQYLALARGAHHDCMDVLRCQTPQMNEKQLWVHLLAYNVRATRLIGVCRTSCRLVQGPKGQRSRAHRVKLLTEAQVVALAERREALLSGTTQARRTCINGICDHCAFVSPCRGSR